jgi:hypothetical protein
VNLVISRPLGLNRDFWLDKTHVAEFGAIENLVKLMPPVIILEKMVELFGGVVTMEKTDTARSMTIGFPGFTE